MMNLFLSIILIISFLSFSSLSIAENEGFGEDDEVYDLLCSENITFDAKTNKVISDSEIFRLMHDREKGELLWLNYNENKILKTYKLKQRSFNKSQFHPQTTLIFSGPDLETLYLTSVLMEESVYFFSEIVSIRGPHDKSPIPTSLNNAKWRCMADNNIEYLKAISNKR